MIPEKIEANLVPVSFKVFNFWQSGPVETLFQYFQREWLSTTKIPLSNVHSVAVRTNNHLEVWQSNMHKRSQRENGKWMMAIRGDRVA
ncbi:hypothetical protein T4E_5806 [Trichinella pseudospiralis]|uniref:Uncharacterized protein n=1 Tax=Trichinella pseudospiralis TaxID=6337 RepID=A0A0V0Y4X0_TRIPS|nr:hypothetical protein T4E_5806 [Trichinella pseudospiralis]